MDEGVIAVGDAGPDGKKLALTWILHNACTSNTQLALISNVCRRWRTIAVETVASEAFAWATGGESDISVPSSEEGDADAPAAPEFSSLRELLVTDMARELVVRQGRHNEGNGNAVTHNGHQNCSGDGSFCLAWFAPSGIQSVSVPLDDDDDYDGDADDGFQFDFFGNGSSGNASAHQSDRGRNQQQHVRCCSEWRGYRHASEVLIPFGYSADFFKSVQDATSALAAENDASTLGMNVDKQQSAIPSHLYKPTFAVRGATLARSEGFCLCLDTAFIAHANSADFERPPHTAKHHAPSCIDQWMSDYDGNLWPLQESTGLSPMQRKRKQSILAKALLPRMVMSTRRKYPLLHRFDEEDADEKEPQRHFPWEKRQRAVQFLNADRSQAVKLITPKFDCGPTHGPITMFVVAITTEDGCFVSGRSKRFEFGHLYPLSSRDMQFDMSPIAIATEKGCVDEEQNVAGPNERTSSGATTSSDDGSDSDSERSVHCLCEFDSGDPFNPNDHDIEEPTEDCIHRGCTGPGLWHCFVAVFDGKDSLIRVDGCTEPKRTREDYGLVSSDSEEGDDDADSPANASRLVGSGVLDGLSIGSDHVFDMSLCYGEIEGECGQGAIAELAVFKGRLPDADIETLEGHLMEKHGLLSVDQKRAFVAEKNKNRAKPLNVECHLQEDEWKRMAHAFIEQRRPWKLEGKVPLRVAANHHSVAWHRTNDITGTPVRISRIGAKNSQGSSDW